jgi:hypothetical protein
MAEYVTEDLKSWSDFTKAITLLRHEHAASRNKQLGVYIPGFLFRGQREAQWKLKTTLERYEPSSLSLVNYYSSIWAAKPQIEAHTGRQWEIEMCRNI